MITPYAWSRTFTLLVRSFSLMKICLLKSSILAGGVDVSFSHCRVSGVVFADSGHIQIRTQEPWVFDEFHIGSRPGRITTTASVCLYPICVWIPLSAACVGPHPLLEWAPISCEDYPWPPAIEGKTRTVEHCVQHVRGKCDSVAAADQ